MSPDTRAQMSKRIRPKSAFKRRKYWIAFSLDAEHAMRITPIFTFVVVLVCFSFTIGGALGRSSPMVSYDDKFIWDKKAFDHPPTVVGGEAAVVRWLKYPENLRRLRIEGRAVVSVVIDGRGAVRDVSFSPRMHPDLEDVVCRAVRNCRWRPGSRGGIAVPGAVSFPVTFTFAKL